MRTYYDLSIVTESDDTILLKGITYSQMMKIAHNNPFLKSINILKEYEKKEKR
jgi:hypothetical protein